MSRFVGLLCMSLSPLWCPSLVAKPWRSGEILSQQTFKYGAFEARIQASRGDGCISSFYLLKDESWIPGQEWQELDFEIFGKDGAFKYQTQIMTPGDPRTQHIVYHKQGQNLSDDFHVYRLEWTPDALIFFFDGKKVRTETDRVEYSKFLDASQVEAMRLRLGLWVGFSDWSGHMNLDALPAPLHVDWIRYYTYNQKNENFSLTWEDTFDEFDSSRWYKANWTFEYAINDYHQDNVVTKDGFLNIVFSSDGR